MPYASVAELPASVRRRLTARCARVWMRAFNAEYAKSGSDAKAMIAANVAARNCQRTIAKLLDDLELAASRRVVKQQTAPSRKARDDLQQRILHEWIDALRAYYVGFAERIGVEIDTTLPPNQRQGRMVNPERDRRNFKVTKRKTFIGLPTRAPFDLPIDWQNEANMLADVMGEQYVKWLNAGTARAATDIALVNADVNAIRGIAGSLQLGDYETSIRQELANRVVRITEVQRTVLRDTVQRGIEAGLSTKEIARGARVGGRVYPGIKGRVDEFYRNRSRVIALTESANAYNLGQLEGYSRSGVVQEVRIFDGLDCGWTNHDDPDKANGTTRTLQQAAAQPTSHPNCQRSWAPVPLAQTQGVGRTATQTSGISTKPPTSTPTPPPPQARVGVPGSRWAQASFDDVERAMLPEVAPGQAEWGWTQIDDITRLPRDPNGNVMSRLYIDKPTQARAREIMRERYGIQDVTFDAVTKSQYTIDDVRDVMLALEDYRDLGVGFDDLVINFTKNKGGGALADFRTYNGTAGELNFHLSLARRARLGNTVHDGQYTGFRSTAQHELGHALDDRTMSTFSGRFRWNADWARATASQADNDEWRIIHNSSRGVGGGKDAAQQVKAYQSRLADLDDEIARRTQSLAERQARFARATDPTDIQLQRRSIQLEQSQLAQAKNSKAQYERLLRRLQDDIDSGAEAFPTNYAQTAAGKGNPFAEDFADTARGYLQNPTEFKRLYPRRAAHFEKMLERARSLPKNYADDVPLPKNTALYQQQEAAKKAQRAARAKAKRDAAKEAARREAERKAQEEAARKAREEAARLEAERRAREEAARRAREEAARRAAAADDVYRPNPGITNRSDWAGIVDEGAEHYRTTRALGGDPGNQTMAAMNARLGTDGAPRVVDSVDDLVRAGWRETYRGTSSATFNDSFRSGAFFPGKGIYGDGTYTAAAQSSGSALRGGGPRIAAGYATDYGKVMRMALHPRAKVISYDDAWQGMVEGEKRWREARGIFLDREGRGYFYKRIDPASGRELSFPSAGDDISAWTRVPEEVLAEAKEFEDYGQWALANGYDAIIADHGTTGVHDYIVILNRTAVAVEKVDRFPDEFNPIL